VSAGTVTAVELVRAELPLLRPFRTSFGTETTRDVLLVRVEVDHGGRTVEGWGECVAPNDPYYSSEYVDGAQLVLRQHLVPRLLEAGPLAAEQVTATLGRVKGHLMAKGALELAVLDAELAARGVSLASHLGATRDRVPSGVSVGIAESVPELVAQVGGYLDEGYVRIKLKIEPGWDVEPVSAVRATFGSDLALQVDANTAYTRADIDHLCRLDEHRLLLIEQPLPEDDLLGHAMLARASATPVCLDESITSLATADDAIELGACEVVNIKAGRIGGYLTARALHDRCRAAGIPVWCGGMLETGIGRAANLALAALPGFTLPGDVSASGRFYACDVVTAPVVLDDGFVHVPAGPGIGVEVDRDALDAVTRSAETLRRIER
jgi:O-succinylbenzoate synthase